MYSKAGIGVTTLSCTLTGASMFEISFEDNDFGVDENLSKNDACDDNVGDDDNDDENDFIVDTVPTVVGTNILEPVDEQKQTC